MTATRLLRIHCTTLNWCPTMLKSRQSHMHENMDTNEFSAIWNLTKSHTKKHSHKTPTPLLLHFSILFFWLYIAKKVKLKKWNSSALFSQNSEIKSCKSQVLSKIFSSQNWSNYLFIYFFFIGKFPYTSSSRVDKNIERCFLFLK